MAHTANVLMSYTLRPILQVLEGNISLTKFQELAIEDENIFFFSNTSNSNLLSLKHAWNGSETNGKAEQVILEIIDPTFEFERLFASTRFSDLIPKLFRDNSEISDETKRSRQRVADSYIKDLKDSSVYQVSKQLESLKNLGDKVLSFWIAYGIGDEFEHWSSPIRVEFAQSEVNYNNNGSRVLTLYFVDSLNLNRDTTNSIFGKIENLTANIKAVSNLKYETEIIQAGKISKITLGKHATVVHPLSWADRIVTNREATELVYDVFKEYLSRVYDIDKDRVIVVIPRIEDLFPELLDRITRSYLRKSKEDTLPELETLSVYQESEILKQFLEYLNFTINREDLPDNQVNPATVALNGRVAPIVRSEEDPFTSNRDIIRRKLNSNFRLEINTKSNVSQFKKIIDALKRNASYSFDPTMHFQTNPKLVELFETYGLVNNASLFNENFEKVLVFGDTLLIRKYLYGDSVLLETETTRNIFNMLPEELKSKLSSKYMKDILVARPDSIRSNKVPSNFFSPIDESAATIINKSRFPILRYGVQNPNVIDLKLDINAALTASYHQLPSLSQNERVTWGTTDFKKRLINRFKSNAETGVDNKPLRNYITSVLNVAVEGKIIDPSLSREISRLETVSDGEFLAITSKLHENIKVSSPASFTVLNELTGDSAFAYGIRILKEIYRQAVVGSIETLPMFYLSNPSLRMTPMLLFALEPLMSGIQDTSPIQAAYSGMYNLVGFSHEITATSVKSTFDVVNGIEYTNQTELEEITE